MKKSVLANNERRCLGHFRFPRYPSEDCSRGKETKRIYEKKKSRRIIFLWNARENHPPDFNAKIWIFGSTSLRPWDIDLFRMESTEPFAVEKHFSDKWIFGKDAFPKKKTNIPTSKIAFPVVNLAQVYPWKKYPIEFVQGWFSLDLRLRKFKHSRMHVRKRSHRISSPWDLSRFPSRDFPYGQNSIPVSASDLRNKLQSERTHSQASGEEKHIKFLYEHLIYKHIYFTVRTCT